MRLAKNKHLIPALILSFLGFLDAAYLTILHFRHVLPNCSIVKGCDIVTTSGFSTLGGIPISLFGALFFLALSFFAILIITHPHKKWVRWFTAAAFTGFLVSLFLFLLQIVILKAICQYCIGSEAISLLLYVLSVGMIRHVKKGEKLGHF